MRGSGTQRCGPVRRRQLAKAGRNCRRLSDYSWACARGFFRHLASPFTRPRGGAKRRSRGSGATACYVARRTTFASSEVGYAVTLSVKPCSANKDRSDGDNCTPATNCCESPTVNPSDNSAETPLLVNDTPRSLHCSRNVCTARVSSPGLRTSAIVALNPAEEWFLPFRRTSPFFQDVAVCKDKAFLSLLRAGSSPSTIKVARFIHRTTDFPAT